MTEQKSPMYLDDKGQWQIREQELREEIAQLHKDCGYNFCEKYKVQGRIGVFDCDHCYADQILALIKDALPELAKEAGFVKLADDQTPPNNVFYDGITANYYRGIASSNYKGAIKDMLKEGWRKVELEVKDVISKSDRKRQTG